MQNAKEYRVICLNTAEHLDCHHTWTRRWTALNAHGLRRVDDDPDVVRRTSNGWIKVCAAEVMPDELGVSRAVIMINGEFEKAHGMVIEDMSDRLGRKAVADSLRRLAVSM